jgi:hypothetical protein
MAQTQLATVKQRRGGKTRSFVCELLPPTQASKLIFQDSINKGRGFWFDKLVEMRNAPGSALKLLASDKSSLSQVKTKAKALGMRLLYAADGEFVCVKLVELAGDLERLMLLLREPRGLNELRGQTPPLELDLTHELQRLGRRGQAVEKAGKWQLTAEGQAVVRAAGARAGTVGVGVGKTAAV